MGHFPFVQHSSSQPGSLSLLQFSVLQLRKALFTDPVPSLCIHSFQVRQTPLGSFWLLAASLGLPALPRLDIWLPVVSQFLYLPSAPWETDCIVISFSLSPSISQKSYVLEQKTHYARNSFYVTSGFLICSLVKQQDPQAGF